MEATPIRLRPATTDDTLLLHALATQVYLETYAGTGVSTQLAREVHFHFAVERVKDLLADPRLELWIGEDAAGAAFGFAQLHLASECAHLAAGTARVELQRLYVRQAAKGRGVGTALLTHCEQRAAACGAGSLWLTAWVGNLPARAFYTRRGYADIGEASYRFEGEVFENRVYAKRVAA